MKRQFRYAYNALKKLGVPVYEREDLNGRFNISAEEPNSYQWLDFYEGYRMPNWDFGINPIITEVLNKYGLWAEWQNAGELGIYQD
jgi:hypothetical protein